VIFGENTSFVEQVMKNRDDDAAVDLANVGRLDHVANVAYYLSRPMKPGPRCSELVPGYIGALHQRLEQCNPWPHVATRHHHAQLARVCRPFSVGQSRDAPIGLLR